MSYVIIWMLLERGMCTDGRWQIGFLTEWQLYAQKLEGDSWVGDKLDKSKLDKMSGLFSLPRYLSVWC